MKKLTTKEFINKAKKIHSNNYNYSKIKYINAHTKIEIVCPKHGSFFQKPNGHLNGKGCIQCAKEKIGDSHRKSLKLFIKQSNIIHRNKYDYSKVNYKSTHIKVKIICKKHKVFLQTPHNHIEGRGCPVCGETIRSNINDFIIKAKLIHKNKYNYDKVNYINNRTKVNIICDKHGIFKITPNNHLNGRGCQKCTHTISKPETDFLDFINVKHRNVPIKPYKVDGLDKEKNIIYEFLGDYWHGNPEKYDPNKTNKVSKKSFGELLSNTFKKLYDLKNKGYKVKYIWENDWNRFKKGTITQPKINSL